MAALISVIIAYGAIGATIIGLLGPVFIPWMVFEKTDFLFWGWLKAFLGFEFYKVVAAATMSVIAGHLLISYLTSGAAYMNAASPRRLVTCNARPAHAMHCRWVCIAQDSNDDGQPFLRPCRWAFQWGPFLSGLVTAVVAQRRFELEWRITDMSHNAEAFSRNHARSGKIPRTIWRAARDEHLI